MAQEEFMATVLDKAPIEYAVILAQQQRAKGDNITMGDLKKVMKLQWRITHKKIDRNESESELVLSAFNGLCYNCGKKGHRKQDCPELKTQQNEQKNNGKKFTGKCNNCGKIGHKAADCWEFEKNKSKRPAYYKRREERGMITVNEREEEVDNELVLMTLSEIQFANNTSILRDANVFIADSGATSDMSPYSYGMKGLVDGNEEDTITNASGIRMQAYKKGTMKGVICCKFRNEVQSTTINDMVAMPDSEFNLFSTSKRLERDGNWAVIVRHYD